MDRHPIHTPPNGARKAILNRYFSLLGVARPEGGLERNNLVSVFLMGALPAVAGSTISFMLAAFFVWGLISLALRRFPCRMTRSDLLLAWTFTIFAALVFLTALVGENREHVLRYTVWLLPFLSLWAVIPRLRATPRLDYLRLYILGCIAGSIGALALAMVQIAVFGSYRLEGGAGNAAVFACICACLAGIAGLAVEGRQRGQRIVAVAATFSGVLAVILSLTRGVMLTMLPVLALTVLHAPARWRAVFLGRTSLALLAGFCVVLYAGWHLIDPRIENTLQELREIVAGGYSESFGQRLQLWAAAWMAVLDSPLWGHGIQNRMSSITPYFADKASPIWNFTHPHNGYLAFALDGGLLGLTPLLALLAMPVAVAWRAPRDASYRTRLFLMMIVVVAYATNGMTQILFKNDILDSFYIFTVIVMAASLAAPAREADGQARPG